MDPSELLSGHLAWWLGGAALVIGLLLAPKWRRSSDTSGKNGDGVAAGLSRLSDEGGVKVEQANEPAVEAASSTPQRADEEFTPATVDEVEMDHAMRLEVARVYIELDDIAGAQALLQQVIEDGDEAEREAAQSMRRSLATSSNGTTTAKPAVDPPVDDGPTRDAENLLDLATAYVEIGDADLARRTVAQIEQVGSETQRRQARALLDRLSGS